jgi:hypothetical protein
MKRIYLLYIILFAVQFILAVICGPYSCDWGNTVYFYFGVFSLIVSLLLPLFQNNMPAGKRIGYGSLFLFISAALWITGFMICGFSVMCRMF